MVDGLEDESTSAVLGLDWTTDKAKINVDAYSTKDKRDGGSPAMVSFTTIKKVIDAPDGRTNLFPNLYGHQEAKYIGVSGEYKLLDNLKVIAGVGSAKQNYQGHLFGTRVVLNNPDKLGEGEGQYYHALQEQKSTTANLGFEGAFDTGSVRHTVGLRADYLKQDTDRQPTARGKPPAESVYTINIYDAVASGGVMPVKPLLKDYADNEFVSYSLTDQVSFLDDKLQLILGLRYQDMDLVSYTHSGATTTATKYSEDKVSPSLGILVKPFGEDISLYASYVEGLSKGNPVTEPKDENYGHVFPPFQTKQYEIGAKYQHGSWLHTLAAYQIDKPSTLTSPYTNPNNSNITQITTDGAETSSKGIEYGFSGNAIDDLIVWGNVAYLDAKYKKHTTANLNGNKVQGQPEFTAGLGVEYKLPVDGFSVNARGTYVDNQYVDTANTLEIPDYSLLDVGAKYMVNLGGVDTTFRANIDNVTDEKYWAGNFGDGFATVGTARTYKLGVTFDF